jgi:uncharacterized membrane protein
MTKVVFAAWLLVSCSLLMAKDLTPLPLQKGARVGIVNLLDSEVTHFHSSKVLAQSFLKTHPVKWQVDSMLTDAVMQHLTQLGLVPVPMGPSDAILHDREQVFVNNSVAKGLPRECAKQMAALAASEHLDALIVLAPGLNNSAQAGGLVRRGLPDYLRGWGFVTGDGKEKPSLFNMTQLLLIGMAPEGATLRAREWGGGYSDEWLDDTSPPDLKLMPQEELDKLQPLFGRILTRQAERLMGWMTVTG